MLNKETIAIEYWRKKYYFQALIVLGIALVVICLTFIYAEFSGLKILILLAAGTISYSMIKELRADLQTRAEALILSNANTLFKNLTFDYGKGINENTLLNQDILPPYQVLEYRNILQNKLFHYEEDLFYSIISSKFLPLKQTVFEGIILCFDMPIATETKKTKITLNKNNMAITGSLSEILQTKECIPLLNELTALFRPLQINVVAKEGKIYFWIKTATPLFAQFSLISNNSITVFIKRIEKLQTLAEALSARFMVDKL